ncbi:MAG: endonuclease [Thermomicrobiales bacterium]|jgi:endonuclease-3|nr:endonuclease [Thermomicrobiales bacterium]
MGAMTNDRLPASPSASCTIQEIARRLDEHYGPRRWRSHGDPVDELVGTILSQHTSDTNTERAFASLRGRFPTWQQVVDAPTGAVADAIRSGGLANLKAPRIQAALAAVRERFGELDLSRLADMTVADARAELVSLKGVGPKTASCVLLFSFGLPAMPVDTHVHRVSRRLGLIRATESAEAAHELLECDLGENRDEVYAFHLNMIAHGRNVCLSRQPRCERCVLTECCDYFNRRGDWQQSAS